LAGTGAAVAVAVAMTCGVAVSSAGALADKPGTVLRDSAVVVPGSPAPTSPPDADDGAPETVAAPAPRDIGGTHNESAPTKETATAPVAGEQGANDASELPEADSPAGPDHDAGSTAGDAATSAPTRTTDASASDDSGDDAAWMAEEGTHFRERMRELVERWEKREAKKNTHVGEQFTQKAHKDPSADTTEENSGSGHPRDRSGWQKGQSHRSPDDRD